MPLPVLPSAAAHQPALLGAQRPVPAHRGVVVVGAGVHDAVRGVVPGEEGVGRVAVVGELQHLHAGQAELLDQGGHFGMESAPGPRPRWAGRPGLSPPPGRRRPPGPTPSAPPPPWGSRRAPPSSPRRPGSGRCAPGRRAPGGTAAWRDPPGVAVGGVAVPVVDGVAPQLPALGEVVGGHPGHHRGAQVGVEAEQGGVRPHVGAVPGHVHGGVAHDPQAQAPGALPQAAPLLEEQELAEGLALDLEGQGGPSLPQRPRSAVAQRRRPLGPGPAPVGFLQGHEQGVVVEPAAVGPPEGEVAGGARAGRGVAEAGEGPVEEAQLPGDDQAEVHPVGGELRDVGEVGGVEEPLGGKEVGAHQVGVAGEGGEAEVGGVAVPGGAEGEGLPEGASGAGQPLQPAIRFGPQVADPVRAGEARGVEQDAGAAGAGHGGRMLRKARPAPPAGAGRSDRGRPPRRPAVAGEGLAWHSPGWSERGEPCPSTTSAGPRAAWSKSRSNRPPWRATSSATPPGGW